MISLTALAIAKIIEKADAYPWSVQGLGMLRLYLSDDVRIHIWHKGLIYRSSPISPTAKHTHPWGFESLIIAGSIVNHRYMKVAPASAAARASGLQYMEVEIMCGEGGGPTDNRQEVYLFPLPRAAYYPGQLYSQTADMIHETAFIDGTVTVITRHLERGRDRDKACVYYEHGAAFVSAEPRFATKEEVALVRDAAMSALEKR
jgi:hypothetical protein